MLDMPNELTALLLEERARGSSWPQSIEGVLPAAE
jgi:hypothetical protein